MSRYRPRHRRPPVVAVTDLAFYVLSGITALALVGVAWLVGLMVRGTS